MTNESVESPSHTTKTSSYTSQLSPTFSTSPSSPMSPSLKKTDHPNESNKKLLLHCSTELSGENFSSAASISPISSSSSNDATKLNNTLKRNRDTSLDDSRNQSPIPPPTKTAKVSSYSIMNILASGKETKSFSNKENSNLECSNNNEMLLSSSPRLNATSPTVTVANPQFDNSILQSQQSTGLNPFLLNPFLAAAAAAAAASQNNNNNNNNNNSQQLNNISNLALFSNLNALNGAAGKQPGVEFWPWLNMAAVSALYGIDKGYPNLFTENLHHQQQLQLQQQLLQQQQQLRNQRAKFASSPASNNRSNTPNSECSVNQLHSQIQCYPEAIDSSSSSSSSTSSSTSSSSNSSKVIDETNKPGPIQRFHISKNFPKDDYLLNEAKIYNLNNRSMSASSTPPSSSRISNNTDFTHHNNNNNNNNNHFFDENRHKKITQQRNSDRSYPDEDGEHTNNTNNNNVNHGDVFNGSIADDEDDEDVEDSENIDEEDDTDLDGNSFDNGHRKKKTRTVFSRNQVFQLESTFDMKRYLSSSERSSLANSLQLTETQIKIWFQNRRNKWKRQLAAEIEANNNISIQQPNNNNNNNHQITQTNRTPTYMVQQQQQQSNNSNSHSNNQISSHLNSTSSQRVVRVPVIYHQNDSKQPGSYLNSPEIETNPLLNSASSNSSSSSSSSTHSTLTSPLQQQQQQNQPGSNAAAVAAVLNNMAAVQQLQLAQQSSSSANLINSNQSSLISPSMLAAAAYYAAAAGVPNTFPPAHFQPGSNQTNSLKQPLPTIL